MDSWVNIYVTSVYKKREGTQNMDNTVKKPLLQRLRPNFIWITFVVIAWYVFIAGLSRVGWMIMENFIADSVSPAMMFTLENYASTILDIITLWLLTYIFTQNRYIWKSFLLPRRGDDDEPELLADDDIRADFYGRSRNSWGMLGKGIAIGFIMNFACIVMALFHGDIKLYYDFAVSGIPMMIFALVCVTIQSSAEELWCRGFMYERLHERYPLWFVILLNGSFFGILHIANPGASVFAIVDIIICGVAFSLIRWYSGSIWIAMGVHAGWNFTQNYLFGLPNSGLISEVSLFHLDASVAKSSLVYDVAFGVEGALPAVAADALLGIICLILAKRAGRLWELGKNYSQTQEILGLSAAAETPADSAPQGDLNTEDASVPQEDLDTEDASVLQEGIEVVSDSAE